MTGIVNFPMVEVVFDVNEINIRRIIPSFKLIYKNF